MQVGQTSGPEDLKKKIRPIYAELQGYLLYSPKEGAIFDQEIWNQYELVASFAIFLKYCVAHWCCDDPYM
jgi:hypothetical protein